MTRIIRIARDYLIIEPGCGGAATAAKDCSLDVAWGQLQVHPQARGCAEELRQPQGGAGGNAAAAIDNLINPLIRHLDRTG